MTAAATANLETVQQCLNSGSRPSESFEFFEMQLSPLQLACSLGKLESVKALFNAQLEAEHSGQGESPLILASKNGHRKVVDHLIKLQVDINLTGPAGEPALYGAARNGHEKVVKALVKAQADVNQQSRNGQSALWIAVQNGHRRVIKALIKAQADVNLSTIDGGSPLLIATQIGQTAILTLLIAAQANVESQTPKGDKALHVAVSSGHWRILNALIKAHADVNAKDRRHSSAPLHLAAETGAQSMADALIRAQADVDAQRSTGATPILIASHYGHREVVRLLIGGQADVNIQRLTGHSPVYVAAQNGHTRIVTQLIRAHADVDSQETNQGSSPLHIAAQNGHCQVVDLLITAQADVNLIEDVYGSSPIYIACLNGLEQVVKSLTRAQAAVSLPASAGVSPLYLACQGGYQRIVNWLIKAQVDINQTNSGGSSLHVSAHNGHRQVVEALINAKADVNIQTASGESPLHTASQNGYSDIVHLLIRAHASVDIQKNTGESPLYVASDGGHADVVDVLLKAQAQVNLQRTSGDSPLHAASHNGHLGVVRSLINSQADVDLERNDGCSPIYFASQNGHRDVVELLIRAQADVNKQNDCGEAPLHTAAQNGRQEIVQLLIGQQADVDIMTKTGLPPLYFAVNSGQGIVIDLLIKAGTRLDPPSKLEVSQPSIIYLSSLSNHQLITDSVAKALAMQNYAPFAADDYLAPQDADDSVVLEEAQRIADAISTAHEDFRQSQPDWESPSHNEQEAYVSEAELSEQLYNALKQSGFVQSRAALQSAVADVLQEILRKRISDNELFVVGSYSEGWGNSLKTQDGRTDIESDIDMMRLVSGQVHHPLGVCECPGVSVRPEYSNGHIMCPGYASNPAMPSFGSNLRPAVDHVVASRVCRYPNIAPLQPARLSQSKIPKPVLQSLQQHLTASFSPCHVVHAASPGRGGQELRVSTSFLEKRLLRSLDTIQGQLFVTLKYLVKKVIAHKSGFDVQGLKPYHIKTVTFRMLEETAAEDWRPENLVSLTRRSLQMLLDCVEKNCASDNVHGKIMSHFFLNDTALYLKGVGKKENMKKTLCTIAKTLRAVIEQLPHLLKQFLSRLKPVGESGRFYFHPFLILPMISSNQVSGSSTIPYHAIPDVVRECLLRLSIQDCGKQSQKSLVELVSCLPDCAYSAREALMALTCLKFGDRDAAVRIVSDCRGHEVSWGIDWSSERSSMDATASLVWQHLLSRDSAWKFCLLLDQRPEFRFVSVTLSECFPLQMVLNNTSFFYMNFDALLWALRFELRTESEQVTLDALRALAERDDADEQELLVAARFCPEDELRRELLERLNQLKLRQVVCQH